LQIEAQIGLGNLRSGIFDLKCLADPQAYNRPMGSLLQPSPTTPEERDSNWLPIMLGVVLVVIVVVVASLLLRTDSKLANAPDPYAINIKFSDLKMSAAENFVGSTISYLDGTVTNAGDKTVTRALVHVSFKDSLGQIVQAEDVPLRILQTSGPYPEALDLAVSPLAPAQGKPFRLTFEHVTADWNHEYPELRVTEVVVKQLAN
jgi:hypothetical protein